MGSSSNRTVQATDLRWRFGSVMAVALAPLLAFSVWQSVNDFSLAKKKSRLLTTAASDVVSLGVENVLDEADTTLAVLTETIDGTECDDALETALLEASAIKGLAVLDDRGRIACRAGIMLPRDGLRNLERKLDDGMETATVYVKPDEAVRGRHLMGRRDGDGRALAAAMDWTRMWDSYGDVEDDLDADAALLGVDGRVLFGTRTDFPSVDADVLAGLRPSQEARLKLKMAEGQKVMVVRPTPVEGLYSAVARPEPSFFGWQRLNLLTGSLIPLVAWLFAFGAIWIAMDRMILSHLRRLREAALYFAGGDMERRVGVLPDAPSQIQQLGDTFDIMATSIGEREARLTTSLEEKSVLLREIHHRVKNNLQIIISLLNMQARELDEPKGLAAIEDARNRVGAIALVHRSLYESDDLSEVDMQPFLETLVTDMFRSLGGQSRGITLTRDLANAEFDPEKAIPLALFVVEALSNAIKHGCPDGGEIHVSFILEDFESCDGEGREAVARRCLVIRDSGQGMVEGGPTSTGWRLMRGFARQLGGELEAERDETGFEVRVAF